MLQWLSKNVSISELAGAIFGLIYLYFSVRQKIWLWPIGILTSGFFIIVFFNSQLYAEMGLQVYYLVISVYGWYHWLTRKDNIYHDSIKISVLSVKGWFLSLICVFFLTIVLSMALIYVPHTIGLKASSIPWMDAFLTTSSILATWMLARKYLDQWLWWVLIDAISVGVFIYKGLYFTSGLFVVNTIMAVIGYLKWRSDYIKQ